MSALNQQIKRGRRRQLLNFDATRLKEKRSVPISTHKIRITMGRQLECIQCSHKFVDTQILTSVNGC